MNILTISPHPDDTEIGCGGTVRKHVLDGDNVFTLVLTSGEYGCPGQDLDETKKLRVHEAFEGSKVLGTTILDYWGEPDSGLESSDHLASKLAQVLVRCAPGVIYAPSEYDSHSDHSAACRLVQKALKLSVLSPKVLCYEVWSPLLTYDVVNDITEQIGTKLLAIRRHESQVNRIRFDEAALALARFRGELANRPHGPYAECFQTLK